VVTLADLAEYVESVTLVDVEPGSHKLQFVLVQPRGQLRILAQVPLTVVPAGDFVGNEVSLSDITWRPSSGLVDHNYTRWTSTFSLNAIDHQNAEGTAHLTFQTKGETTYSTGDCRVQTLDSGLVEWDTPVTGFFSTEPDGTVYLAINATVTTGPPFLVVYTRPGCTPPAPSTNPGDIWTGVGGHLTDGRLDLRIESPLGTDETGEHYYELHLPQTNGP
jgi:hypothetical protein